MRRKAIEIEKLMAEAPKFIHAMLVGIVEKKSRSALIGLIEPTKAKVPEAASLSSHELALSPKAKLVEFAKKAGVPNEKIQDALSKDIFFADADGDGQKVSASGAATASPNVFCVPLACPLCGRTRHMVSISASISRNRSFSSHNVLPITETIWRTLLYTVCV